MMQSDSTLSVKDATGRQISLLNDHQQQQQQQQNVSSLHGKRKYHCTESGCHKSFTTSGHLARHHRIHTGEKNFHCLHPGCPSRFSRQDNMMQHYRTHLSPKTRRQQVQQRSKQTNTNDYPRLHCHTLVGSDEDNAMHPLINPSDERMEHTTTIVNRSRRATTLPSSFHPYHHLSSSSHVDYFYNMTVRQNHHLPTLIQPLSTMEKPLPMEPDSAPSPSSSIITSPTMMNNSTATSPDTYHHHHHHHPYQVSRRPQRAHSSSSTCSTTSSSSFLSPRPMSPPLVDPTDIIYPKHFIQLPPPPQQHKNHHYNIVSHGHHHRQGLLDLAHTVSIFG